MAKFKEGDRVRVKTREPEGKEAFEGRYAPHLGGTTGTVLKVYNPEEIAVDLDIDSLPPAIRTRHAEQQSAMHEKWLNSLSDEARGRLTDEEKSFRLRYVVLLPESDLEALKSGASTSASPASLLEKGKRKPASATPSKPTASAEEKPIASKEHKPSASRSQKEGAKVTPEKGKSASAPKRAQASQTTPARPTLEQLEQLEEQYLKKRKRG